METGRISKKARQRQQLILALLQQPSTEKAAAAAGMSAVTAWRISKTPEFQQEYRQARLEVYSQSTARLQSAAGAATSTILRIMADGNVKPSIRLQAAHNVLELGARALELEDLNVRLQRVEAQTKKRET
jgi:hypothetical protein